MVDEQNRLARITVKAEIFGGKPIVRGRRLTVEHVLTMLAAGDTAETQTNASAAMATLQRLGFRPRAPVPAEDLAKDEVRTKWREDKGLAVFSRWSPSHPGTEVGLFVEEPFDFNEAWSRRLDAVLDDGTTVHVVGILTLRSAIR